MKLPFIVFLAIFSGFTIPLFLSIFTRIHFFRRNGLVCIFGSSLSGFFLWIILLSATGMLDQSEKSRAADLLCGVLVLFCAFWCNYWLSNFGGGFRFNMLVDLAKQDRPLTIEEWMDSFNNLGMDVFYRDRIESILLPWKVIEMEGNIVRLTSGWGRFFGICASIMRYLLNDRS